MYSDITNQPLLKVNNLTVKIQGYTLVDNVNFEIKEKDKFLILGPNGAGKSTIIKGISQSIFYKGNVLYYGQDVTKMSKKQIARHIGVLSQYHPLNYAFTVEEIVEIGRYPYRKDKNISKEEKDYVHEALEMTGMIEKRRQSVLTLSGGEIQRTFLAQLFAQNPNLLILDEPTNYLDIQYQEQMFSLIQEWIKRKNRAVLAVIHDLSLATYFGNSFLLLNQGKSVAYGKKGDVIFSEQINVVYEMNVERWIRNLYENWVK